MCMLMGMMQGQILKKLLGHLKKVEIVSLYIEKLCPEYHLYVFEHCRCQEIASR